MVLPVLHGYVKSPMARVGLIENRHSMCSSFPMPFYFFGRPPVSASVNAGSGGSLARIEKSKKFIELKLVVGFDIPTFYTA